MWGGGGGGREKGRGENETNEVNSRKRNSTNIVYFVSDSSNSLRGWHVCVCVCVCVRERERECVC